MTTINPRAIYSRRNAFALKLSSWALSLMDTEGQDALNELITRGIESIREERLNENEDTP